MMQKPVQLNPFALGKWHYSNNIKLYEIFSFIRHKYHTEL